MSDLGAHLRAMDAGGGTSADEQRGREIDRRRLGLGIKSLTEFAKATKVSRKAITAAIEGRASSATYRRLEAWLVQGGIQGGSTREKDVQVKIREISGDEMPEGHDWAVVYLDNEVWLLTQRLDVLTVHMAPAETDAA